MAGEPLPPALCVACERNPATKAHDLCGACYAACWRRHRLGDSWVEAVRDRQFMVRRRRAIRAAPLAAPSREPTAS